MYDSRGPTAASDPAALDWLEELASIRATRRDRAGFFADSAHHFHWQTRCQGV